MNKYLTIIALLALLAIGGFTLYFINQGRLSEKEALMQDQMMELQAEQQRLAEIEGSLRQEREESERLAQQAEEARRMAEAQAEKERQEREKLVAELNARLQREAEERRQAEAAQQELARKFAELEQAQREARAAMAALEEERQATAEAEPTPEEALTLQETIKSQEAQLVALAQENEILKQRQQQLEKQQIATEEAIISAGGKIELAYPEIRSPNIRRREAIYFKQRILGNPTP